MIDLKETYGKRFKIRMDESYAVETYPGKEKDIAWYHEIDGRKGQIYNHSDKQMQMWISPWLGPKVSREHPDWKMTQDCTDGCAFVFPNNEINAAFEYIKPRRRRQITERMRQVGRDLAKKWPLKRRADNLSHGTESVSGPEI